MARSRGLRVIAGLLLLFAADSAFSDGPPPRPPESAEKQQPAPQQPKDTPHAQQRGTEDRPLVVKVAPAPKSQNEIDAEREDRKERSTNDHLLIALNVLLVLGTGVLAVFTAKLWIATDRLVSGADKTAETQLRAYVALSEISTTFILDQRGIHGWRVNAIWRNFGRTPTRKMATHMSSQYFPGGIAPPSISPI